MDTALAAHSFPSTPRAVSTSTAASWLFRAGSDLNTAVRMRWPSIRGWKRKRVYKKATVNCRRCGDEDDDLMCTVKYVSIFHKTNNEIINIVNTSQQRNRENGIHSVLWFDADTNQIAQVIQGRVSRVRVLLRNILSDRRHTRVKVVTAHLIDCITYIGPGIVVGTDAMMIHEPDIQKALLAHLPHSTSSESFTELPRWLSCI